jgi:hypothetical protein
MVASTEASREAYATSRWVVSGSTGLVLVLGYARSSRWISA